MILLFKVFRIWFTCLAILMVCTSVCASEPNKLETIPKSHLPHEAQKTLILIRNGRPLPFAKDGAVFGNFEKSLPKREYGYYHEYTVVTRGSRNRGSRRIVVGGESSVQGPSYYTDDHYATFKRIKE